jgi:RNA polymerase sigma factor (sigma-70 family)
VTLAEGNGFFGQKKPFPVDVSRFCVYSSEAPSRGLRRLRSFPMKAAEPVETHPDLTGAPDEDLLAWMATRDDEESAAKSQAAFAAFYNRYEGYVYNRCRGRFSGFIDEDTTKYLVGDTFLRVYEKAGTFRPSEASDPDQRRRELKAWLVTIAANRLFSSFRAYKGAQEVQLTDEEWAQLDEDTCGGVSAESEPLEHRLVREAFEQLNDKQKLVVEATLDSFKVEPSRKQQRLSNEVSKALADKLGTTPEDVRQIRRRAYRKMREYVQARLQQD